MGDKSNLVCSSLLSKINSFCLLCGVSERDNFFLLFLVLCAQYKLPLLYGPHESSAAVKNCSELWGRPLRSSRSKTIFLEGEIYRDFFLSRSLIALPGADHVPAPGPRGLRPVLGPGVPPCVWAPAEDQNPVPALRHREDPFSGHTSVCMSFLGCIHQPACFEGSEVWTSGRTAGRRLLFGEDRGHGQDQEESRRLGGKDQVRPISFKPGSCF